VRSIIVHLRNATEPEVAKFLAETYPTQKGPPWICEINGDACLHIDVYRDGLLEYGIEGLQELKQSLGYTPTVSIGADVSGRHPGDDQVRSFVSTILKKFEGRARDDYSDHCWTIEEILSGHLAYGHPFFDYRGWYDSRERE